MNYPATTECISGNHVDCSGAGPLIDAPLGSRKVVDCKCTCHDKPASPEPREPAAREAASIEAFWGEWCHRNAIESAEGWLELTPKQAREFALAYSAELRANLEKAQRMVRVAENAFQLQEAFTVEGRAGKLNGLQIAKAWLALEERAEAAERSLLQARLVIEAARCIRHWHDSGRNNEGMIVSSEHVRKLWEALGKYDD